MGKLTDILFADLCVLCGTTVLARNASLTCTYCWADLPWLTTTCRHCALPLNDQGICGTCLTKPLVRGLAIVPLRHEAEAQHLVAQLKFHKGYREGKTLAACMANRVEQTYLGTPKPSALVATPLSYLSLVRRGYNQSALLAQTLAKTFGIELIAPLTKKHTPAQRTMTRQQRLDLSADVFRVTKPIRHSHVALVDDVLTTDATVKAMAASLSAGGVTRVDVWCATRAVDTVGNVHTL